ncbi:MULTISPECIES: glycosyltransferase family 4 protein [Thalassospira]|uniref:Glycosyl transferase family 1 domain-containing protein n=1 Tax=Thalassospira profundimaris TaxID=502049 RepID=A0A367VLX7_9PROT|nr:MULTISPECIES: glycosyltransferase family 4 protein [Thalassospira]KZB70925.1 hypothetical protein AUQ43_08740 [Thalassospira sp. MCCC 1A01148]MBR9899356.1 glycosyltransferase family 4 protein [Rhodospirillales bacterium]RCK25431.1 hypothetical protein TH6_02115 [Thalassospira profundimaris]
MKRRLCFLFPLAGRTKRLLDIKQKKAPADFFYGALALEKKFGGVHYVDLRKQPLGLAANAFLLFERVRNRFTNFGLSRERVRAFSNDFQTGDIVFSLTDSGSLSIGRYRKYLPKSVTLVGGFHGLSDIVNEASPSVKWWAEREIQKGLLGLDHYFFFGEEDKKQAIKRYSLDPARCSLYPFGVDLDFWRPSFEEGGAEGDGEVFAVGSDPKRDYETLLEAVQTDIPLRLLTRLKPTIKASQTNVEHLSGSLHGSAISDEVLRELYQKAEVVVVPVRDVAQPSGYSVSLQAMACGKATVISGIQGLWDKQYLVSGKNCLIVPPEDHKALRAAILSLLDDPELRRSMGRAARDTAEKHFGLVRMDQNICNLAAEILNDSTI